MATKINISYSLKQNGIVSCWWHSVAGANRYSAFIRLVANGKAIGTSFTAATECLSSEKVIAGGVYRISVSARDAKNREIGSGELKFTVPSDFYARNLTAPTRVKAVPGTESVQISFDSVSGALSYDVWFDGKIYSTARTSYTITGLLPNSSHSFMVRAKNSNVTGPYSATQTVVTNAKLPEVPTGLKKNATENSVTVSWNVVSGATGYDLKFDESVYSQTGTSRTITGLTSGTSYKFQVRAKNSSGTSAYSSEQTVSTAPKAPSDISASSTSSSVTVSWTRMTGAGSYIINFNNKNYTAAGASSSLTISGLQPQTTYSYKICSVGADGTGNYSSVRSVTTQAQTFQPPAGITKRSTNNSATISWSPVSGATGYDLKFNGSIYSETGTSRTFTGLSANTAYRFQVRAKKTGVTGTYSAEQTVTTAPRTPSVSSAQATHNTATVKWDAVPGATGYDLKFNGTVYSLPASQTSKTVTGLQPKTSYSYQICAKNADGTGTYSAQRSIQTQPKLPEAPSSITTVNTENSTELKWNSVSGATGYDVMFNGRMTSVSGTSKKYTGLSANTKYPYKVRSKNSDGAGEYSSEKTAQTAPKPPTGVKAVTDEDSANLSWDSSSGATGYEVDADGKKYSATGNSHKVSGLSPNTSHTFKVSAKNAGGTSTPSSSKSAKTTPKAPASPKAAATKNSVTVSWPSVSGATSYDVMFDGKTYRTTGTSKSITGLSPNTSHTYAVRCNNADGSSRYGAENRVSTLPSAPSMPSGINATASKNAVTVSWQAVSGADNYDLEFNGTTYKVTGTSKSISGLAEGTRYYYRLRANNAGGSSSYTSSRSVVTLMSPPAAPSNVHASSTHDTATVSWYPAARATSYNMVFNGTGYSVSGTSQTVRGLRPDTNYSYKVCAVNSGGSSAYSSGTVRTQIQPPAVPENVTASATKDTAAVKWDPVSGATGYDLLFDGTLHSTTEPAKTVTGLKPGKDYTYQVRAKNAGGPGSYNPVQTVHTAEIKKDTHVPPRRHKRRYPNGKQLYTELDPVNVVTGAFMWQHTWLGRNGKDNLEFVPMYESQRGSHYGKMGNKWTHSLNYMLYADDTYVYFETPDGSIIPFYRTGEKQHDLAEGVHSTYRLKRDENFNYYVTDLDGTEYHYDHSSHLASVIEDGLTEYRIQTDQDGKILEIAGRHGEKLKFTYQNGYLAKVADETGNEVSLLYKDKCLAAIRNAEEDSISFTYDADGNLLTITDFNGAGYLTNTYDQKQRIVKQVVAGRVEYRVVYDEVNRETYFHTGDKYFTKYTYDADGNVTEISNDKTGIRNKFDSYGRITEQTDVFGNVTGMTYDSCGRMNSITYPDETTEKVSYNQQNQPTCVENRDKTTTRYTYDDRNNITAITDENGNTSVYEYDEQDNLIAFTDKNGAKWQYTYDSNNHLQEASDCLGNRYQYGHDAAGRLVSYTSPTGSVVAYTYSKDGSLLSMTDADGEVLYSYDANGSCTSITDRMGHKQQFAYNEAGQLISATDAMGAVHTFIYDDEGNLKSEKDALAYQESCQRNQWGSVTSYTDKNGNTTSYTFDDADRLTVVRNAAGGELRYAYDIMGQVTAVTDERGHNTSYLYDHAGNVTKVTDPLDNTVTYTYDGNGNILSMTDEEGIVTEYSYDSGDRLLSITREEESISFAYDELGRLISVEDSCGHTETADYDGEDRLTAYEDKENNRTTYTYDSAGRITAETAPNGAITKYTYDKNGNCLAVEDALGHKTTYEYDANNRLTKVTDAAENCVTYDYDARGMLTTVTDANNGTTVYEYDGNGNLVKETDPAGGTKQYTYDRLNRITRITDEEGHVSACEYDASGNMTKYIDANGNSWTYTYDAMDRMTTAADKDGAGITMEYTASGRLSSVTDQEGARTDYTYDRRGRLTKLSDASGSSLTYTYDAMGRVLTQTDALGNTTTCAYSPNGSLTKLTMAEGETVEYTYNALGQVETMCDTLGNLTTYTHDALGQVTGITDAIGNMTAFTYTADGRIATVTDALGNTTAYEYDGNGNLMSVTDALGSQTAFEYDALNNCIKEYRDAGEEKTCITLYQYDKRSRMIKEINPLLEECSYSYDGNGNLTEIVDEEQNHIVVTYDLNNLPTSIQYGTDKTVNYRYNSRGQLVEMQDWTGTTAFSRDILGRLTKVKDPDGRETGYEYDAMGNRTGILYPDGSRSAFSFDKNDRLKKITDAALGTTAYDYDKVGNLIKAVQPGNTVEYTYDKNNRPVSLSRQFGETIRIGEQITYDALGRITQHDSTSETPEYVRSRNYMYDAIGQLTAYSDGENTETYLYDALGNRTAKHLNGSPAAAYQYNAFSQLTAVTQGEDVYSYHYDRRGNLTEERHGDQVLKNYVYDAANRMISGTNLVTGRKSEYTYNGLLARVKKASDAIVSTYIPDYIGGIHNDLVTQVLGLGTVNAAFAHGYSRASQRFTPEAGVSIPAADTYFQNDLYGSPLFAADADGMIKHRADHNLWGMPKNACEDSAISAGLRFTTYKYDPVLEKHFAHARLYDPAQGRMLGTDPVKRGLNGYAYCGNDPVNQTDPTGEIANVLVGGILGAAAGGIIGGAFGFAGSALSQLAEGKGFNARKAWGAAANGAIVGAARGALTGSGVGIPAALGVNFAAGMAGSLAEQKLAGERMSPMRAAVDGAFNALGGRIYGTSPLRNAKDAFIRGALEGAVKGGAYNIADVLDNKLRNAYGPKKPAVRKPQNLRGVQPTRSRCPQKECEKARPFAGMKYAGKDGRGGSLAPRNDRFSLGRFVRDVAVGAVMGGLASVAFYGAGKGVAALERSVRRNNGNSRATGKYIDKYGNRFNKITDYLDGEKFTVPGDERMYSMNNKNGGTIVVTFMCIEKDSFDNTVKYYNSQGRRINIISGTHGSMDGRTAFGSNWFVKLMHRGLRDIDHYDQDQKLASKYNNVEAYDIIKLSTKKLRNMINGSDVTICAWCYSERSRDVIKAIKCGG